MQAGVKKDHELSLGGFLSMCFFFEKNSDLVAVDFTQATYGLVYDGLFFLFY